MLTPGLLLALAAALLSAGAGCASGHTGGTGSSTVEVSLVPQTSPYDRTTALSSASGRVSASSAPSGQRTPGARPSPSASAHRSTATVSRGMRLADTATAARSATPTAVTTPHATEPTSATVFLAVGTCVAAGTGSGPGSGSAGATSYSEVACTAGNATAVVIRRLPPGAAASSCPGGTDFALQITSMPKGQVTGIACARNLTAPHPGDPGGGGGFGIVVGDCMDDAGSGRLEETACTGTGAQRAGYRIIGLVARDSQCPSGTTAYITVHNPGSPVQVACAVSLH
ncbi:hypothetical protein [Streptacidiphilus carbonis]|uniref:hypothetical protein n=1 Tax=Streptacidiphilus carbonis TaxID=105422 RepID=UPI0006932A4C|nr:hypothetical protein [Streptacidiphilus carbonis]